MKQAGEKFPRLAILWARKISELSGRRQPSCKMRASNGDTLHHELSSSRQVEHKRKSPALPPKSAAGGATGMRSFRFWNPTHRRARWVGFRSRQRAELDESSNQCRLPSVAKQLFISCRLGRPRRRRQRALRVADGPCKCSPRTSQNPAPSRTNSAKAPEVPRH